MIKLNNKEVKFGRFPNGELNLPLEGNDLSELNIIELIYENNEDLIKLALVKGMINNFCTEASLHIHYMPYSRMDRPNGNYAVSINAICDLINGMNFKTVLVREPHSEETTKKLNNVFVDNWCYGVVERVCEEGEYGSLFFPDYGAKNRYKTDWNFPVAYGKKKRNFLSGDITELEISGETSSSVLIIDDICSKGGTFVEAAKKLKEKGVKRIGLLVSYCEENVFNGEIFNYIDRIYTNKDIILTDHPRITKI